MKSTIKKFACSFGFVFATFLLLLSVWLEKKFDSPSIAQIEFALRSSITGTDMGMISSFIRYTLVPPVLFLVAGLCLGRLLKNKGRFPKALNATPLLLLLYIIGVGAYVTVHHNLVAELTLRKSNFIKDNYQACTSGVVQFPEKKRNLIIILSESLESTFNEQELFNPVLLPELYELQKKYPSFSGHIQLPGTGWTIAGMTSYFFGIPLKLPIEGNSYSRFKVFLPNAGSILTLFEAAGYEISLFTGANGKFSGKINLFKSHAPKTHIRDLNYFLEHKPESNEHRGSGWGLADYYMFDMAKEYLSSYDSGDPFMLILETVDTHVGEDFFVKNNFPQKWGDERDSFMAQSAMIGDFIHWAQTQEFYNDTTIIVLGDHLLMRSKLGGIALPREKRSIFNLFVNIPQTLKIPSEKRIFSSMDMCPTILESVGATLKTKRIGLGSSLFSDEPTLLEQFGEQAVAHELMQKSVFYNSFY